MSGSGPIGGHNGPSIGKSSDVPRPEIEHRFERQNKADFERHTATASPVVGHLRFLVRFSPDAVPDEVANDSKSRFLGGCLDCGANVAQSIAGTCLFDSQLQSLLRDPEQALN